MGLGRDQDYRAVAGGGHVQPPAAVQGGRHRGKQKPAGADGVKFLVDAFDGGGDFLDIVGLALGQGLAQFAAGLGAAVAGDAVHHHVQEIAIAQIAGQ